MVSMHTARVAPEKTESSARPAAVLFAESFGESEMKLTYAQQLKHPNWQKKRLEVLESAGWACEQCMTKDVTLHVHHKQYFKGRMAWEYERSELAVLCEECHEEEHTMSDELKALLALIDTTQALALLRGFHVLADFDEPWIGDMGRDRDPHAYACGFVARITELLSAENAYKVAEFAASLSHESGAITKIVEDHGYLFGRE